MWIAKKMQMSEDLIQQAQQYLSTKEDYSREKRLFKQQVKTQEVKNEEKVLFSKGDRVYATQYKKEALVFEDTGEETIVILSITKRNGPSTACPFKMRAEELYPVGYEIDQLFTDFKTRNGNEISNEVQKSPQNY